MLKRDQEAHSSEVAQLSSQIEALEIERDRFRRAEHGHAVEAGRLHAQIDMLSEMNRALKVRV